METQLPAAEVTSWLQKPQFLECTHEESGVQVQQSHNLLYPERFGQLENGDWLLVSLQ